MPLAPDDLSALADAALGAASGCQAAELRVERIRSQTVRLHDAHPDTTADDTDFGMGVRVVVDGAVGFAATVDVRPEEAAHLVREAMEMARVTGRAGGGRVELAPEPSHGDVTWSSSFEVDPSTVPVADKVALLSEWSSRLGNHPAVSHTTASLLAVSEQTYLADLNGTRATQHRVRLQAQLEALALSDSGFETMRTLAPPVGRGWEFLADPAGDGNWDWDTELAVLPELLAEKLRAPPSKPAPMTSSSIPRTCGSRSTSRSGTPPSWTGPSATRRRMPGLRSRPSTSWAPWPTDRPSCT